SLVALLEAEGAIQFQIQKRQRIHRHGGRDFRYFAGLRRGAVSGNYRFGKVRRENIASDRVGS
ncbi:hypothetical protein, partial [Methylocystis parvus]|uniref:hypothetical protein n=1 Tax=Methylocystis parvus TaxID=134 RepID=UPI001AEC39F7